MRYVMQQKLMAVGDDFSIKDETGRDVFYVDGYGFSFGKKLAFQNMRKKRIGMIKQKLFSFRKAFSLQQEHKEVAVVSKSLFSFKPRFFVNVPGPEDYDITGRLLEFDYKFTKNGKVVASVSKKRISIGDAYIIDIEDNENAFIILSSVVVIDLCCHNKK